MSFKKDRNGWLLLFRWCFIALMLAERGDVRVLSFAIFFPYIVINM